MENKIVVTEFERDELLKIPTEKEMSKITIDMMMDALARARKERFSWWEAIKKKYNLKPDQNYKVCMITRELKEITDKEALKENE